MVVLFLGAALWLLEGGNGPGALFAAGTIDRVVQLLAMMGSLLVAGTGTAAGTVRPAPVSV